MNEMTIQEKNDLVNSYTKWYHEIQFEPGVQIHPDNRRKNCGVSKETQAIRTAKWGFSRELFEGKDVLDVGPWDGINSFAAEELGAKSVTALDGWIWKDKGFGSKAGFDIAKKVKNSNVKSVIMPIEDATPEEIGQFDVILFMGVLYHLEDPISIFVRLNALLRPGGILLLETVTSGRFKNYPPGLFFTDAHYRVIITNANVEGIKFIVNGKGFRIDRIVEGERTFMQATKIAETMFLKDYPD